ncbi:CaiB/BaiF CoA-transferase family protein [uncultured Oscillibacter sp.]|jgi:CoA:oxalate CoA-transferase|uniref:CaiB/BaiF CoA transferase family protein n=1 Tax=uncultured Oscillibacter sp. TaxID=876091 RepID=UPI0025EF9213|nr:CaiB/BaiF CoA-transferase family protein [uncultured Oscillibacter sp.]
MKQGPLKGIKVLDFSQVLSAPFCGMMLADMGAEVIKVERPGPGDISREYGPYINDISLYFCQYNRGKKGIAIDMRSEEGKKVVLDLVAQVDVVVENFKAGTLEKLGIGYDKMLEVNPGLIYGSISGFGTYGPLSHLPCMDIIAAARSGLVAQSGQAGDAPIKPGFSLCDTWAGLQLLRGLSMALLHRQRTGQGLRVDIAMLDCAFYMCESPVLEHSLTGAFTERTGNHHAWYAPYGEFAAKDGNLVLAVSQESEWTALCGALGLASLAADPRFSDNEARVKNRDALIQELEKVTKGMGRYELEAALSEAGVPAAAVQSLQEFHRQPQTETLDVITQIQQEGVGTYTVTNTPIRFSRTPVDPNASAAGHPGAHSREILQGLGYGQERIDALLSSGAVHQAG